MGTQDPSRFKRWIFLTEAMSILLGFGIFLHACDRVETKKERQAMEVAQTNSMGDVAVPPIDRSAPLKTETATFALG
jgi:hypothetical protein